ncbi:insulinase family protein [Patescibacteria group bacterium]|nr:insulinase family protein [Patescibacteria group bacterium]MBU1952816.1 insulinase family protein [Patescibacteria group bacterium]
MFSLKDFGVTKEVGLLENGTRVVLFNKPSVPISINVAFNAGSRFDPNGKEGLAHFTEHMLLQKTKKFNNVASLFKYLEEVGGRINVFTDSEQICLTIDLSDKEDFDKAVTIIDEVVNNMIVDDAVFENERSVIMKEIADIKSNPQSYVGEVAEELFFQNTDIGRSVSGDEKSVSNITKKDILNLYNKKLNTNYMTVIVSGGIELNELILYLNEGITLQKVTDNPNALTVDLSIFRESAIKVEVYKDTDNVHLVFGFRSCSMFDNDHIPLAVLSVICGSGFTSSLYKKLREEKGLVYGVSVDSLGMSDSGAWVVSTSTPKENVQQLLDIVCDEFNRIYDGGIFDSELRLAKDKIIKSRKQRMQTSRAWVDFHTAGESLNPKKARDLDKVLDKISKVTLGDLRRVGRKYFSKNSWYLAMCGDTTEKDFKINY